jgi:hypothetical protein
MGEHVKKIGILAAAALALGACAGPPAPAFNPDAFKGIYNQSSASVPADVPVTVQTPVGIIFSDNVETWFQYIKTTKEYWAERIPSSLTNNVVIADTDPNYFTGTVLAMLKRHFPNSEVVKGFQQAVSSGKKAVCLIDIQPKSMDPYGDRTTKIDVAAYFFDAKMNPVSRLSGHGEHYVPLGAGDGGVQISTDAAVSQIDQKLTALVH